MDEMSHGGAGVSDDVVMMGGFVVLSMAVSVQYCIHIVYCLLSAVYSVWRTAVYDGVIWIGPVC